MLKPGKTELILFFILLVFTTSIYAAPPFQASESGASLSIAVPHFSNFPQDNTLKFHIHVYNSTGFLLYPNNNITSCYFHLYNQIGSHVLESNMLEDSNGQDYYIEIDPLPRANYGYIVWCNNSQEAGFYANEFGVSPQATDFEEDTFYKLITYFWLVIIAFIILMHIFAKDGGASMVYGSIAGTITLFQILYVYAYSAFGLFNGLYMALLAAVAMYCFAVSWTFYKNK